MTSSVAKTHIQPLRVFLRPAPGRAAHAQAHGSAIRAANARHFAGDAGLALGEIGARVPPDIADCTVSLECEAQRQALHRQFGYGIARRSNVGARRGVNRPHLTCQP